MSLALHNDTTSAGAREARVAFAEGMHGPQFMTVAFSLQGKPALEEGSIASP
jgi:hypothetical protein